MTTPESQHAYEPVKMHLASIEPGLSLGARPVTAHEHVGTLVTTFAISPNDTDVYEFLPHSPNRIEARFTCFAGPGGGTNVASYGWISTHRADAAKQQGLYVSAGGTIVERVLRGHDAMWLAIDPAASAKLLVTVVSFYRGKID